MNKIIIAVVLIVMMSSNISAKKVSDLTNVSIYCPNFDHFEDPTHNYRGFYKFNKRKYTYSFLSQDFYTKEWEVKTFKSDITKITTKAVSFDNSTQLVWIDRENLKVTIRIRPNQRWDKNAKYEWSSQCYLKTRQEIIKILQNIADNKNQELQEKLKKNKF